MRAPKTLTVLILLFLLALASACGRESSAPPPPVERVEGYVDVGDGVRLWYRSVGSGAPVIVAPFDLYLGEALEPLAEGRRLVTYDPRNRGRSDRAPLREVSLARQAEDLEALREALGIERMLLVGWSGGALDAALYAQRFPERVERLVQLAPVAPRFRPYAIEVDEVRRTRYDRETAIELEQRYVAGEFDEDPQGHCRAYNGVSVPANLADPAKAPLVPDVCNHENEWPRHLWPYFSALLGPLWDFDLRPELGELAVERLVVHCAQDPMPRAGTLEWVTGHPQARLLEIEGCGHFPFVERSDVLLPALAAFADGAWPEGSRTLP